MYENLALTLNLGQFFFDSVDFKKENKLNCVFQSLKNEKLGSVSFEN